MSSNIYRVVSILSNMPIEDNKPLTEKFFSRSGKLPHMTLGINSIVASTNNWIEFAGGEVHIKMLFKATLDPSNDVLAVNPDTKLFECISESMVDLNGGDMDQ
jgi:hypothetical protein